MNTTEAPYKIFQPSMGLRIARKKIPVFSPARFRFEEELQQAWVCHETGEIEWRAIEIVDI